MTPGFQMMIRLYWFSVVVILGSGLWGCSARECKSTSDCSGDLICRNGNCVEKNDLFGVNKIDTDSQTATSSLDSGETDGPADSGTGTGMDTSTSVVDSGTGGSTDPINCNASWQCNDDNRCTVDSCEGGRCVYTQAQPLVAGCCNDDDDCDDSDDCTADRCDQSRFACDNTFTPSGGCCRSNADCDDENSCTTQVCGPEGRCQVVADLSQTGCCEDLYDCPTSTCSVPSCDDYQCVFAVNTPLENGCCQSDTDCVDDGNLCTVVTCDSHFECSVTVDMSNPSCCEQDVDCEDFNPCTDDLCGSDKQCIHSPVSVAGQSCCASGTDCADGNNCTAESCVDYVCRYDKPSPLPTNCCNDASDCDDHNDCTTEVCSAGICTSRPDPSAGPDCCVTDVDCTGGNGCEKPYCDDFDAHCYYLAPDPNALGTNCCVSSEDCLDEASKGCNSGVCGKSSLWQCDFVAQPDFSLACNDGLYCNGPEYCMGGVCVTDTDATPCGNDNICRVRGCDNNQKVCTLQAEYGESDTDIPVDDGIFCNGQEICFHGDLIRINPPCQDTDENLECAQVTCDETAGCGLVNVPDNLPCSNTDACDGQRTCQNGVCTAGSACGEGNDCMTYSCSTDPITGQAVCASTPVANGTSCKTPDLGACYGTNNRVCLDGVCSIGDDPMCGATITGGFCADYQCVGAWGPTEGCFVDNSGDEIELIDCDAPTGVDTSAGTGQMVIPFSTVLEYNKVADYGDTCGSGYTGGDLAYGIQMTAGDTVTIAFDQVTATSGQPSLMLLSDACAPQTCFMESTTQVSYTATGTENLFVVVDMQAGAFAKGVLKVTCQ